MIYDLQKASMWKRISAFLFDGILLGIAAVLFAWLLSVLLRFDVYNDTLNTKYEQYGEQYGVSFSMGLSEYEEMTEENALLLDEAYRALGQDEEAVHAYRMVFELSLAISSLGIFIAYMALEFAVPLALRNGQTLGKKIFGLALMKTEGVRVNGVTLFVRTILGKYTLETMIPVLLVIMISFGMIGLIGTVILILIFLIQGILLFTTRAHSLIHDLLANTVEVDLASQMIFESREAMIAYKEKKQAEEAARAPY